MAIDGNIYGLTVIETINLLNVTIDDIKFITSRCLIINAKNDPIIPNFNLKDLNISSENVEFRNPDFGGHVGFSSKISLRKFDDQFLQMPREIGNWFLKRHKSL